MSRLRSGVRALHARVLLAALLAAIAICDVFGVRMPAPSLPEGTRGAMFNIWVQIGLLVVSAIISYALAPRPQVPKPAALADFQVPTAEEGRPIPVVFGTVWLTGPNVLWYGDLYSDPIKKKGGK
jgi:hypothetical protein